MQKRLPAWARAFLWAIAWLGSSSLALVDLFVLRGVVLAVATWMFAARTGDARVHELTSATPAIAGLAFLDQLMLLIMGGTWIVLAILFDHYYQQGLKDGSLPRRAVRAIGIQAAVVVAGLAVQALL